MPGRAAASDHAPSPPVGFVDSDILAPGVTATQSEAEAHETELMEPAPRIVKALDQAEVAAVVGLVLVTACPC